MTDVVGRVAALGAGVRVQGFALAGALVSIADDDAAVRSAWLGLPHDVTVVILTPQAATVLADLLPESRRLSVVMP